MHTIALRIWIPVGLAFALTLACTRRQEPMKAMDVNLFSGVQDFAKIGDSEAVIVERAKNWKPEIVELTRQVAESTPIFHKFYHFKDLGMKLYYRSGRVALIELQEPFRGNIQGKRLKVFSFAAPSGTTWERVLIKEFGAPEVKASGGRFGAEAFFYSWGDVSFNRMGPNELALYRDRDISNFRQKNFGRDVKFWSN